MFVRFFNPPFASKDAVFDLLMIYGNRRLSHKEWAKTWLDKTGYHAPS